MDGASVALGSGRVTRAVFPQAVTGLRIEVDGAS
jgi:hypothetical protein